MPLTYQNPWNFSDTGSSLGELLARVPQIRAQQAIMQQQMALEAQKVANEQQYQQGMLGVHNQANQISAQTLQQNAPEVAARTKMLLGEADKYSQEQARQQKLTDLATMFGKAYRTAAGYPSYNNYQGGPTMDNAKQLNLGDLAQSEATIEAMNPHQSLIGNTLRMQAQQQQGPFSTDQLNALITGGHLNNPHVQTGFNLSPGQTHFDPSGQPVANLPETPNSRRSAFEQFVINMGNQQAKSAGDLPPNLQAEAMKNVWGLTNLLGGPQQAPQAQVPTVKTKEEYLKLPKGSKYIGPDGKLATKQ